MWLHAVCLLLLCAKCLSQYPSCVQYMGVILLPARVLPSAILHAVLLLLFSTFNFERVVDAAAAMCR
jgi:hypothetical protein